MKTFGFVLVHDTMLSSERTMFGDPVYAAITLDPPRGCKAISFDGYFALDCEREAEDKWEAVTGVIAEVRSRFGLVLNDLGIKKVYEWFGDDPDGFGPELVAQLLSMAAERGRLVGLSTDRMVAFLRAVEPPASVE